MYDTTHLWLGLDKTDISDRLKALQYLTNITKHQSHDKQVYFSGYLNNYKVNLSDKGISLKGSLGKYYLSNNYHTLTRLDTARGIEQLADNLHLPIDQATVGRIDFSQNFLMDYKPEAYYTYLGECQNYNRLTQPKSLYYSNKLRQKLFYNKIAEGKSKNLSLPEIWEGKNVLRYELRFISRLPKQFNRSEITANTLSDEKFYMEMFDKWHSEYESIEKLQTLNYNLSNMKSPKDFMKILTLHSINSIGHDKVIQEVENLRAQKAFDKPEYYSRLKKDIRVLCNNAALTTPSDLVEELDKKIKAANNYCR